MGSGSRRGARNRKRGGGTRVRAPRGGASQGRRAVAGGHARRELLARGFRGSAHGVDFANSMPLMVREAGADRVETCRKAQGRPRLDSGRSGRGLTECGATGRREGRPRTAGAAGRTASSSRGTAAGTRDSCSAGAPPRCCRGAWGTGKLCGRTLRSVESWTGSACCSLRLVTPALLGSVKEHRQE